MHRLRSFSLMPVLAALALLLALAWGRTRTGPEVDPLVREIFPAASTVALQGGVHHAYASSGALLGWAAMGEARGYGGPLSLLVGIDTLGHVAGVRVVEQRETPIFWRMARVPEYLRAVTGRPFREVPYDYRSVVSVTGATLSTDAVVEAVRASVARVAGEAFDVRIPVPQRPFEFGLLEIAVLALFAVGVVGHRLRGPLRRRLRWGAQLTGLMILGFWKNSPITLAKISAMMAGFFPDPRTALALYLLLAGFLLTSFLYGRNLYCLYACPFGAAQRVVGAIGGFRLKVPPGVARVLVSVRDLVVFAALFLAFLSLQPVLSGYEPFAALFSLQGTTLQWLLLFLVLTASLFLTEPWCAFLCPMGTVERALRGWKRWLRGGRWEDGAVGEVSDPGTARPGSPAALRLGGSAETAGSGKLPILDRGEPATSRFRNPSTLRSPTRVPRDWRTLGAAILGFLFFAVILGVIAQNWSGGG